MQDDALFDLGELDAPARASRVAAEGRATRPSRFRMARSSATDARLAPLGAGFSTSLSIFLPGAGQILLGETAQGLFFLTSIAFLGTFGWAVISSFDRLTRTLDLFGIPAAAMSVTLVVLYALMAILHLCAVLHAHSLVPRPNRPGHPVLAALASMLVPGWGQMRNGCYGKGTLFLGCVWAFAATGILVSGALRSLDGLAPSLPTVTGSLWFRALLITGPIVIWTLAVYDAAAFARAHRGR